MIQHNQYVPVLKWRQGEYQSLMRLDDSLKDKIVPLIVIPPIEYDFEERRPKKNIDEHLVKFGRRLNEKWGKRLALIDMHDSLDGETMDDGRLPIQYIMDALDGYSCNYVPVLSLGRSTQFAEAIKNNLQNIDGVALRLALSEIANPDVNARLSSLIASLDVKKKQVDLIIDLVRPDIFTPYSGFGKLVSHYMKNIFDVNNYRSLVLIGTSLNLKEIKKPGGEFDRHEWIFYQVLIEDHIGDGLIPAFGDYSIEPPEFQDTDFRLMNPAGKIIYTCDDTWMVIKGGSFRDNRSQMVEHCRKIIRSMHYSGNEFSWGDAKISEIAENKSTNYGQLGTWKQVGVSHHLTKVIHQIANYFDS